MRHSPHNRCAPYPGCASKKRRPALSAEELRHLAKSFEAVAQRAHKVGEVEKAERFERKAVEYKELARKASGIPWPNKC